MLLRRACASLLGACLLVFVIGTRHWTLISDAVLMHYVVFLTRHGFAPYRQIVDINMPGTYLLDLAWTSVVGTGAAAWRMFDLALLTAAGAAMVAIARPYSRFAGFAAATLFALLHGADGVAHAGERDFVVAVLLLAGCACLLEMLRGGGYFVRWSRASASASRPLSSRKPQLLVWP